jgi:hypothetical protein
MTEKGPNDDVNIQLERPTVRVGGLGGGMTTGARDATCLEPQGKFFFLLFFYIINNGLNYLLVGLLHVRQQQQDRAC